MTHWQTRDAQQANIPQMQPYAEVTGVLQVHPASWLLYFPHVLVFNKITHLLIKIS